MLDADEDVEEEDDGSLVLGWQGTVVLLFVLSASLCHLPLCLSRSAPSLSSRGEVLSRARSLFPTLFL